MGNVQTLKSTCTLKITPVPQPGSVRLLEAQVRLGSRLAAALPRAALKS